MSKQKVQFKDLGLLDYQSAWDYQEELLQQNVKIKSARFQMVDNESNTLSTLSNIDTKHHLLFVEHPPVYTLGKSGDINHVLISDEMRTQKGIEFFKTNRGGDITYHGPGQIVGYPIFDLEKFYTDIGKYLRNIEEVIIRVIADYGIEGGRSAGETGVWIDADKKGKERKICAIGVRTSRWITMHGFALNVNPDLHYFNFIVPCGIADKQVTSLQKELGRPINMDEIKEKVKNKFEEVFGIELITDLG